MESALTIALEDFLVTPGCLTVAKDAFTSTNVYAVPVVRLSGAASK